MIDIVKKKDDIIKIYEFIITLRPYICDYATIIK